MNASTPLGGASRRGALSLRRLWPLGVLAVGLGAFFALGLDQYLTFEAVRANRASLTAFVTEHAILAAALYMLVYAAVVALSVPGGAVLTITGGFCSARSPAPGSWWSRRRLARRSCS